MVTWSDFPLTTIFLPYSYKLMAFSTDGSKFCFPLKVGGSQVLRSSGGLSGTNIFSQDFSWAPSVAFHRLRVSSALSTRKNSWEVWTEGLSKIQACISQIFTTHQVPGSVMKTFHPDGLSSSITHCQVGFDTAVFSHLTKLLPVAGHVHHSFLPTTCNIKDWVIGGSIWGWVILPAPDMKHCHLLCDCGKPAGTQ